MSEFTKGEWVIKEAIAYKNQIKVEDKKGKQGKIIGNIRSRDDAHLIAAAPEMYEMLASLLRHEIESVDTHNRVVDLLAKSRGQQ